MEFWRAIEIVLPNDQKVTIGISSSHRLRIRGKHLLPVDVRIAPANGYYGEEILSVNRVRLQPDMFYDSPPTMEEVIKKEKENQESELGIDGWQRLIREE